MNFRLPLLVSLLLIIMTGCEEKTKTVYNLEYIETLNTSRGDLMVFTKEDGSKKVYFLDPSDSYNVEKNNTYNVNVSVETLVQNKDFVRGIEPAE